MTTDATGLTRRATLIGIGVAACPVTAAQGQGRRSTNQASAPTAPGSGQLREVRVNWSCAPGRARLRPSHAPEIDVWSVEAATPAAPLRITQGDTAVVNLTNRIDVPLALHWHGVRGPAAQDGVGGFSQDPIPPGSSAEQRITPPDAGTFLIRPMVLGRSGEPQDRGIAGALIVQEREPPPADQDIVVMIDDWLLTDDHKIAPFEVTPARAAAGRLGSWLTVNGRPPPERLTVQQGARVRIRLINACNARIMRLRFDGMRPFVIAVDGQPTDTFEPLRASLPFAPGNRYDLMVDVPAEAGATGNIVAQIGPGIPLLMLVAGERAVSRPALAPIGPLKDNGTLPAAIRLQDSVRAEIVIEGGARAGTEGRLDLEGVDLEKPWRLNAALGSIDAKPLFIAPRGRPVTLSISNRTAWTQVLHVHGHAFRLLHGLDDGWEPYWLDTVQIPEGRTLRIAFQADNPGRWLISSAVADRFDAGLWTWFEVAP
jgi:FtsP/CotA-like multicopper oxidase with cupredoxin domain